MVHWQGRVSIAARARRKPPVDLRPAGRRFVLMMMLAILAWMEVARAGSVRLVVIVHPSQSLTDISSADIHSIYVCRITRWPSRRAILPIVVRLETAAGKMFVR